MAKTIEYCHFCNEPSNDHYFSYTVRGSDVDTNNRRKLPVCGDHFDNLCDTAYSTGISIDNKIRLCESHLPHIQRELISIKRLEISLNVKNKI